VVALVHAIFIVIAANERGVIEAARQYARELILSTEELLSGSTRSAK
jgi:hypothetical protein